VAAAAWPSLGFEDAVWDVHPVSGMSRVERRWVGRPYRAAVVPPIATAQVVLSSEALAEAEEAAVELARLDAEMGTELAPYSAILLRTESVSSSRIENITAGARAIAEAEATGEGRGNAAVIVANVAAMREALRRAGRLDEEAVLAMHAALLGDSEPDIAGRFRTDQVWVGPDNVPHTADFVPPVAADVPRCMADLVEFVGRDDLPAVVQAAIGHAQFETIHPFSDGNGRTGRALLNAVLRAKRITVNAAAPVSAGLLVDRENYISALTAYRHGDPDRIVTIVARAALLAAANSRELVDRCRAVRAAWAVRLGGIRSDSAVHRLADGLVQHPVVTARDAGRILGGASNVHRHLRTLVERGVVRPRQDHRTRDMTWRAQDVLDLLDEYAGKAGRRGR
jgi:Fic family protein